MTTECVNRLSVSGYGDRSWWRDVPGPEGVWSYRADGPDDTSRVASSLQRYPYGGDYCAECSSCYLGHSHTLAVHVAALERSQAQHVDYRGDMGRLAADCSAAMWRRQAAGRLYRDQERALSDIADALAWARETALMTLAERAEAVAILCDAQTVAERTYSKHGRPALGYIRSELARVFAVRLFALGMEGTCRLDDIVHQLGAFAE